MKRSEVLKLLEEEFRKYENPSNIALRALSVIENAGMLPPTVYGMGCDDTSCCPHEKNEWHPE